ncbi:MAG: hypothetical protein DMD91_07745 [Candidatus Rokuibacteriota bacterium]|nr:MAG: hypothetical protein DMD91_07745 [Candidatus Rokubacteria bacterium]
MMLFAIFLHVLGVVVWMGGVMYQAHVLLPMARRGQVAAFALAARRARPVAWTALALIVLTGLYNVTRLGPLVAGKLGLVLVLVALAGQRDFAQVTRLNRLVANAGDPAPALSVIAWLDRIALLLGLVIIYLGLAISRS